MSRVPHLPIGPLPDFERASKAALAFLHEHLGMGLWMVTRVAGEDWIVLTSEDHGYDVAPGTVFPWADSFCSRMVQGEGPRIAPISADVPAYRDAPIAGYTPIGSYIGVPLQAADGDLFGTLCAIDPAPQAAAIADALPMVELLGDLLSGILALELRAAEAERSAERARRDAALDPLTGLVNRRGWDEVLVAEEDRCRRHGHPAIVVSIDLDGLKWTNDTLGHEAGDELLRAAGRAIAAALRRHDFAARIGGDEFAVLAPQADAESGAVLVDRLQRAFAASGVRASVGVSARDPARGLTAAMADADDAMYESKKSRRGLTPPAEVAWSGRRRRAASGPTAP